jgi:hypothetical protein
VRVNEKLRQREGALAVIVHPGFHFITGGNAGVSLKVTLVLRNNHWYIASFRCKIVLPVQRFLE